MMTLLVSLNELRMIIRKVLIVENEKSCHYDWLTSQRQRESWPGNVKSEFVFNPSNQADMGAERVIWSRILIWTLTQTITMKDNTTPDRRTGGWRHHLISRDDYEDLIRQLTIEHHHHHHHHQRTATSHSFHCCRSRYNYPIDGWLHLLITDVISWLLLLSAGEFWYI